MMSRYVSDLLKDAKEKAKAWNPAEEVGLLAIPCGTGKTTAVLNGSLASFISEALRLDRPIKQGEIGLYIPRKAPIEQLLSNPRTKDLVTSSREQNSISAWNSDKVTVGTTQSLTYAYNQDEIASKPIEQQIEQPKKLIVIDEAHLLSDVGFAPEMDSFISWIEDCVRQSKAIVVFMTASPQFLKSYLFNSSIGGIDLPLFDLLEGIKIETPNQPKRIELIQSSTLQTLVNSLGSRINSESKMFIICHSKEMAWKIVSERNEKYKDACLQVAKDNNSNYYHLANKENMLSIINDNKIKDDINLVVSTNILEAGIELKDPSIKLFATDSITEEGIVQGISRARDYQLDCAYIVSNAKGMLTITKSYQETKKEYEVLNQEKQEKLKEYYEEQKINKDKPQIVYYSKDIYKINRGKALIEAYQLDCAQRAYVKDIGKYYYLSILDRYNNSSVIVKDGKGLSRTNRIEKKNQESLKRTTKEDYSNLIGQWYSKDSPQTKELQKILGQLGLNGNKLLSIGTIAKDGSEPRKYLNSIGLEILYQKKQIKGKRTMYWYLSNVK